MIKIIRSAMALVELQQMAEQSFSDLVKAVVDVRRAVMAIGGELHADEEALLLQDGSIQEDLWGINLFPAQQGESFVEFDSMINVRPRRGNRSRGVESVEIRKRITEIVQSLIGKE